MAWDEDQNIFEDLDALLDILSNSTRRKIIQLLASESLYPFQIARLLDISPRLIGKYIKELEEANLVTTEERASDKGPTRVYATLKKGFSLIIDVSPNNFSWKIVPLGEDNNFSTKAPKKTKSPEVLELSEIRNYIGERLKEIDRIDKRRKKLVEEVNNVLHKFNIFLEQKLCDYTDRLIVRELLKKEIEKRKEWVGLSELAEALRMWSGEILERMFSIHEHTGIIKIRKEGNEYQFSI